MEQKKKIMIVEDDTFVMDIYHTKLAQEGFSVISAGNGIEGLEKLKDDNNIPDLMLLDILMPYMDGLEMLAEIKKDERLKNIPVVLLTNLSQKDDVDRGLGLGANDYLIKSHFTPSEVLEKIAQYLKK
ncbi:MAG: response regulator [Candidatus Moraniibacteriota bacterium]